MDSVHLIADHMRFCGVYLTLVVLNKTDAISTSDKRFVSVHKLSCLRNYSCLCKLLLLRLHGSSRPFFLLFIRHFHHQQSTSRYLKQGFFTWRVVRTGWFCTCIHTNNFGVCFQCDFPFVSTWSSPSWSHCASSQAGFLTNLVNLNTVHSLSVSGTEAVVSHLAMLCRME